MDYKECKILCKIEKSKIPLVSHVDVDEFTTMVQNNFDYEFTGDSEFYPYELPSEFKGIEFGTLVITGASGSGKSTLLKELLKSGKYTMSENTYDNTKAIVSNFNTPEEASYKLSAVGLNSLPVWCRPRNVLSVGEGFRADVALNLDSNVVFDEFTSTIDRNVAKSTCNGLNKYIKENNLHNMVFCSCHKDFIPFLKPDIVIDLDEETVYDCRGECLGETLLSKCTNQQTKTFGEYLGDIII